MEFMGRLAALVPKPRVNLTRFHGVFSRGGLHAEQQTAQVRRSAASCRRTREPETKGLLETGPRSDGRSGSSGVDVGRHRIEKCEKCGGPVRIIAMREMMKIQMLFPMRRTVQILKHLGLDRPVDPQNRSPPVDLTDQQTTLF